MATTAGALSLVSVGSVTASVLSAAATGGTAPYTYQWYRSTTSGFSPGAGNIITGATALALSDTGLIPGTKYYYEVIATDSGSVAGNSAQLAVTTTQPVQSQNTFLQSSQLGMLDLKYNHNTVSVEVDSSQVGVIYPGQCVKIVDSVDGVPKVVAVAANSDSCLGVVVYNQKDISYAAGARLEIATGGNCIYMYATGAISRGVLVTVDVTTVGGVGASVGSSGANQVGWAYDKAAAAGALIRIYLKSPSFTYA